MWKSKQTISNNFQQIFFFCVLSFLSFASGIYTQKWFLCRVVYLITMLLFDWFEIHIENIYVSWWHSIINTIQSSVFVFMERKNEMKKRIKIFCHHTIEMRKGVKSLFIRLLENELPIYFVFFNDSAIMGSRWSAFYVYIIMNERM